MPEPVLLEDACRKAPLEPGVAVNDDLFVLRNLLNPLFEVADVDVVGASNVARLLPVGDLAHVEDVDRRVVKALREVGGRPDPGPPDPLALFEPGGKSAGKVTSDVVVAEPHEMAQYVAHPEVKVVDEDDRVFVV